MGGTEIGRPLRAVYDLPTFAGYPRTVSQEFVAVVSVDDEGKHREYGDWPTFRAISGLSWAGLGWAEMR